MRGWGTVTGLLVTGVSALHDEAASQLFDLTAVDGGVDGYVRACDFAAVIGVAGLVDDVEGDVVVRVVPEDAGYTVDRVLTAAVAVDLAESLNTRESAAGIGVLEDLLDRFRSGDVRQRIPGCRDV